LKFFRAGQFEVFLAIVTSFIKSRQEVGVHLGVSSVRPSQSADQIKGGQEGCVRSRNRICFTIGLGRNDGFDLSTFKRVKTFVSEDRVCRRMGDKHLALSDVASLSTG
jgi:hypothetical protein